MADDVMTGAPEVSAPSEGGVMDALSAMDSIQDTTSEGTVDTQENVAASGDTSNADDAAVEDVDADPTDDDSDEFPAPVGERQDKRGRKLLMYEQGRLDNWKKRSGQMLQLEQEIPGFTLDSAKEAYTKSQAAQEMLDDFHSADPQRIDDVLGFYAQESPHALGMMAMRLPGILQRSNSRAYGALVSGLVEGLSSSNPQLYSKIGGEAMHAKLGEIHEQAKRWVEDGHQGAQNYLNAVDAISHFMNRRPFQPGQQSQQRPTQNGDDPRIAQFQSQLQSERQIRVNTFDGETQSAISSARDQEIETALASVKDHYKDRPRDWKNLVRDFKEAIDDRAAKTPIWARENERIQRDIRQAVLTGNLDGAKELQKQLVLRNRQLAADVIRANRKALIEGDTEKALQANAGQHQKAKTSQQQRESAAPGRPLPPSANSLVDKARNAPGGVKDAMAALGF